MPWDHGKPQAQYVAIADQVGGTILDVGCGSGENALLFAGRGQRVTGIDFVDEAIRRARVKAAERGLSVEFLVKDALALEDWGQRFDSVIDCGLFHALSDDDRGRYVQGLSAVVEPGGRLFLMCRSDQDTEVAGPRRISRPEILSAFATGWTVESIEPSRFDGNPGLTTSPSLEVGPNAWFAVIRRQG